MWVARWIYIYQCVYMFLFNLLLSGTGIYILSKKNKKKKRIKNIMLWQLLDNSKQETASVHIWANKRDEKKEKKKLSWTIEREKRRNFHLNALIIHISYEITLWVCVCVYAICCCWCLAESVYFAYCFYCYVLLHIFCYFYSFVLFVERFFVFFICEAFSIFGRQRRQQHEKYSKPTMCGIYVNCVCHS